MAHMNQNNIVWTVTLMLILYTVFQSPPVDAGEKVNCKVFTIEASNDGTGIDAQLQPYASIFSQKPFDTFNSFKLTNETVYQLSLNSPAALSLPGEWKGSLEYRGKNDNRLKLNLNLSKNQTPPIIIEGTTGNGIPFIAAGFKSPKGRWVFAVKCTE